MKIKLDENLPLRLATRLKPSVTTFILCTMSG